MEKTFTARPLESLNYVAFSVTDPGLGIILLGEALLNQGSPVAPVFTGSMVRYGTGEAQALLDNVLCRLNVSSDQARVASTFKVWRAGTQVEVEIVGVYGDDDGFAELDEMAEEVYRRRQVASLLRDADLDTASLPMV